MSAFDFPFAPRMAVWIGCMNHYNNGALVGHWFDADRAGAATLEDVHRGGPRVEADCEELWCMDHEGLPTRGECSPDEAQAWADLVEGVEEEFRGPLLAWIEDQCFQRPEDVDVEQFRDAYQGYHVLFSDFAYEWLENTDYFDGWADNAILYFDRAKFERDLAAEYVVIDVPGSYGVWVFARY